MYYFSWKDTAADRDNRDALRFTILIIFFSCVQIQNRETRGLFGWAERNYLVATRYVYTTATLSQIASSVEKYTINYLFPIFLPFKKQRFFNAIFKSNICNIIAAVQWKMAWRNFLHCLLVSQNFNNFGNLQR